MGTGDGRRGYKQLPEGFTNILKGGIRKMEMEPKDSQIPEGFIDTSSNKHVLKPEEAFNVSKETFNPLRVSPPDIPSLEGIGRKLDNLIQQLQSQKIILTRPKIDENLEIPPEALEILREVLLVGAAKGHDKWWEELPAHQVSCAEQHIAKLSTPPYSDSNISHHLNHAFTRLMMAAVIQHRNNLKQDDFS